MHAVIRTYTGSSDVVDEAGTTESMSRAATWVQENLESRAALGSPEVTTGQVLIGATA